MQNQNVWQLLLVFVVTAPLAGCQYRSAGQDVEVVEPIATTIEAQTELDNKAQGAARFDGELAFKDPMLEAPPIMTADLIQSTDPSARAQAVSRSRVDPFGTLLIPLAPEPIELPEETRTSANTNASTTSGNVTINPSSNPSTASTPANSTPPPAVQVRKEPVIEPSPIAKAPPIPKLVIAPTVAVSGIVLLGNTPYAIVRAGNAPERYVKVGDRIGNGSVTIKRIDTLAYEPKVIFEENGIEVAKPVSGVEAEDVPTEDTAEPIAVLPASRSTAFIKASDTCPTVAVG